MLKLFCRLNGEFLNFRSKQIQNLEKGSDLWNECKDAITAFNNAVKNNLDDEELDDYIEQNK